METPEVKTPVRDVFLRIIAVIGLIAVLLLGAWGIIQLAVAIPSLFSNIGGGVSSVVTPAGAQEVIVMSQAATITSGQTLQVSWNHENKNSTYSYSYSLSYACQNGLSLKAPLPTGAYQAVACNTPFNFTNATVQTTVVPALTGNMSVPLTITVSATNLSTGAITTSASGSTTVAPAAGAKPAATTPAKTTTNYSTASYSSGSTSYTYVPATAHVTLYGYPDLATRIVNVTPEANGIVALQFSIENDGTNIANAGWTFNAVLPINGSYTFASQPQRALYPGDKIVYTLTFSGGANTQYQYPYGYTSPTTYSYSGQSTYTGQSYYTCNTYGPCANGNPYTTTTYPYNNSYTNYGYNTGYNYGSGVATITADPYGYLQELNKANNTASVQVPVY